MFKQARWYMKGPRSGPITLVVIHDMEMPENGDTAEACADYFARTDKKASAHHCVDSNSVVGCVREGDIAYHAPGANHNGIGIEHAGYARQSTGEWLDEFGTAMLRDQSAPLVRRICDDYGIPKRWLSVDQVRAGWSGITSHNNVSLAFRKSTHTDPGPNFPIDQYMAWVLNQQEDDMTPEQDGRLRRVEALADEHSNAFRALQQGVADLAAAVSKIGSGDGASAAQIADELAERLKQ